MGGGGHLQTHIFLHFQELHFQKCHFQIVFYLGNDFLDHPDIFEQNFDFLLLTFTLSKITLLKVVI